MPCACHILWITIIEWARLLGGVPRLSRPVVRALLASAAVAAAVALAGCNADDIAPNGRAQAPLSQKTLSLISEKNMDKESPILIRIFKEEAELEIWKVDRNGQFALLKTYPICKWSGDLGPKKKEGDRQAPEGFYTITPAQMNPNSNYYLAFNTGFPNAYDRAHGCTGADLMVHGDCSSRGCYAMTDEQILEIYALARESFFGGQSAFQFEAFPFRMTALNMARHRNNPNFAFWKMLKEGYDNFEATHQEPKVAVCEKRYVFDGDVRRRQACSLQSQRRLPRLPARPGHRLDRARLSPKRAGQDGELHLGARRDRGAASRRRRHQPRIRGRVRGRTPTTAAAICWPARRPPMRVRTPPARCRMCPIRPAPRSRRSARLRKPRPSPEPAPASEPAADSAPVVMASVRLPTPAPQPKEGQAPEETQKPANFASLFGNLFNSNSSQPTPPPPPAQAAPPPAAEPTEQVALRGTNTEMAAKPKRPEKTQVAAAPISLQPKREPKASEPKPQRVAAQPKQDLVWEQPKPAPRPPASRPSRPSSRRPSRSPSRRWSPSPSRPPSRRTSKSPPPASRRPRPPASRRFAPPIPARPPAAACSPAPSRLYRRVPSTTSAERGHLHFLARRVILSRAWTASSTFSAPAAKAAI